MVKGITEVKVVSVFHDICTDVGDEIVAFSLHEAPAVRFTHDATALRELGSKGNGSRRPDILA
jgi:hypothetical protein